MIHGQRRLDAVGADATAAMLHTGIVHQQMDARPTCGDVGGGATDRSERRKITLHGATRRVAAERHDCCAARGKRGGGGLANPAARAGDDCYVR